MNRSRLRAVACEVLYREMCYCVAKSRNIVDLCFLTQGLHDLGAEKMLARLQEEVNATDAKRYGAVVLAYALCNNGIVGLRAPAVPLVVPRAHDCITLFFGSHERYKEYFDRRPGTYFHTTGWRERDGTDLEAAPSPAKTQLGAGRTYEDYVAAYGEDNARYIMETLGDTRRNYDCLAYIDMGIREDLGYDRDAEQEATKKGWAFERIKGDLTLLNQLVDGDWDERRFLVVPPGHRITATYDGGIIACCRD